MENKNEYVNSQNNSWKRNKHAEKAEHGEFIKRTQYTNKAEKCSIFIGFYKLNDKINITFDRNGKQTLVKSSDKDRLVQFINKIDSEIPLGAYKNEILDQLQSYTKLSLAPNWIKRELNSSSYMGHQFTIKDPFEAQLFIGYSINTLGQRRIEFSGDQELLNKIKKICKQSFLDQASLNNLNYIFLETSNDIGLLKTILNVINSVLPLSKEIKEIAYNKYNIKVKSFLMEDLLMLKEISNKLPIAELIKKAKQIDNESTFWELATHCEQQKNYNYAFALYQEITEENPYYQKAIDRIIYILRQYLDTQMSETEKNEAKNNQFKFVSMSESPDMQRWLDLAFHELSGGNDLNPVIKNVKPNIDTLISTARLICSFRHKVESLQTELAQSKTKKIELNGKRKSLIDNLILPSYQNAEKPSKQSDPILKKRRYSI